MNVIPVYAPGPSSYVVIQKNTSFVLYEVKMSQPLNIVEESEEEKDHGN